ncbi:NTF2-like N-terminal transpeptidase domain-containing protein, partial [Gorillibacterium massiliense]|uniref:NTF2-like N-terminal transpeptidase domain-containing protein n=1 Tax=Gorillibacterium massiliense TaxID=1280390 RepID=UPI002351C67A
MSCLLSIFFSACKSRDAEVTPVPEKKDIAQLYLSAWQQRDYEGMYKLLTAEAKASMTEAQFAERYTKIYEGIEADHLEVTALPEPTTAQTTSSPSPEPTERSFRFHVRMDTIAGPIEFDNQGKLLKAADGNDPEWLVEWKPSLLFPDMSEGDTVRVQTIAAARGEIKDRNGNGLAINGTVPQLGLIPGQMGDSPNEVKTELAKKLGIDKKEIEKKLNASWVKPGMFVPIAIIPEESIDEFRLFPGAVIQQKKLRQYPYGEAAAHLTGYIGEANADELEKLKDKGYETGDWIGKAGLEQILEDKLRGTDGVVVSIVDGKGVQKADLADKAAVPGQNFQLTIDAELQKTIYNEVKEDGASVAAIQPMTGDVLALLSSPSYDPNAFVSGLSSEQYKKWNDDPHHPFLNRFSKGYAPGSSFKMITGAIGL